MGFFDLNIPYLESDRHVTDKSALKGRRLKLVLKAMELGFTGVAYNLTLRGVMSDSDRCSTTLFPLAKLGASSSSSFVAAVKFHRELLNVPVSSPFRQYTRLTVIVDSPAQASALNSGNPVLKSYDIVAVRPMNQNAFDQACQTSEVDMIAIEFSDKLPFRLKQPMVKAAVKRGVYFEITYSGLISDAQSRRQIIANCKLLVDWTRGQNLIISSAASSATELRGPHDAANLLSLVGLPIERAKAAISKNCRSLLANTLKKRRFYKEAIKVERMPSAGEVKFSQSAFDEWDPISSGEGDLLLDEMEKSFAISNSVKGVLKTVDFSSNLNGLPAHGLQIKDLIGVNTSLEQSTTDNSIPTPTAMEIVETTAKSSTRNPNNSTELKAELMASDVSGGNDISGDSQVRTIDINAPITDDRASEKFPNVSYKSSSSANVGNHREDSIYEVEAVAPGNTQNKFDIKNEEGRTFTAPDTSSHEVCVAREQCGTNNEATDMIIDRPLNLKADSSEQILHGIIEDRSGTDVTSNCRQGSRKFHTGRDRRKRSSAHKPFLFPFKLGLSKKKTRKLKRQ
ncbi:protein GAMETOPHYTE DEFECTIVE 1 [Andrographis paniculata]|uniref:protein GAMETOPHYTE DEFECTIVE 1 n=1 Tax=Andrographis paniculata TaxID=175694 RepID=UPI0021E82411|nr:protein GAMETOPHYTE DEFECTIVE 1 [Andrographis paniculata]XP_051134697.1 protein GAMETOPHYTE DEFECTIVE 1 [Andrographis paniculata]XP_051134698.1 protein GAMETOPHYTE DEFECTIVE 1 [Andrographis paniculata]XP_051134699.1 protein GAMETOPHYTE DEFECTIVE 1 [Andrographis paniculata]